MSFFNRTIAQASVAAGLALCVGPALAVAGELPAVSAEPETLIRLEVPAQSSVTTVDESLKVGEQEALPDHLRENAKTDDGGAVGSGSADAVDQGAGSLGSDSNAGQIINDKGGDQANRGQDPILQGVGSSTGDYSPSRGQKIPDGWFMDPQTGVEVYYKNGAPLCNAEVYDGGSWYYVGQDGAKAGGWKLLETNDGKKWVYYDPAKGSAMVHGQSYNPCNNEEGSKSHWYLFNEKTGAVTYGWAHIAEQDKWVYYDDANGWMLYGEQLKPSDANDTGKHWYCFDNATGAAKKGWQHLTSNGGKWVYYDDCMSWMLYGEQHKPSSATDNNLHWYYFNDATGAATYGFKYIASGNKWVYYDRTMAWMVYGTQFIDGYRRRFDEATGACDKVGFQNDPRYYQVSSWNVSVPGRGQWAYATPSLIGVDATKSDCIEAMISRAFDYLGTSYVWDYACAPGVGIDCAGLVMQCLYAAGMDLSPYTPWDHYFTPGHDHYANDMWNDNRFMHVDFGERRRGDLICYAGHIAIYLGNDQIIEAYPPRVRVSNVYSSDNIKGALRPFN